MSDMSCLADDRLLRRLPCDEIHRAERLEPQNGGAGIGNAPGEKRLNVKNHAVCG